MRHPHEVLSRIEFVTGLGAGMVGILGAAYAVFGPTYRYAGRTVSIHVGRAVSTGGSDITVSGSASIAQRGLAPATAVFLVAILLLLVSLGLTSYWHSRRRSRSALTLLWTLTSILLISVMIGAASVGLFLLPAALLAIGTAALASLAQAHPGT